MGMSSRSSSNPNPTTSSSFMWLLSTRCSTAWNVSALSKAAGWKKQASAAVASIGSPPQAAAPSNTNAAPGGNSWTLSMSSRGSAMHNWQQYVRERLPRLTVSPERENEIVAELALQLEQAYTGALTSGVTEQEALSHARNQICNWEDLAREINLAERYVPAPSEQNRPFSGFAADVRYALR